MAGDHLRSLSNNPEAHYPESSWHPMVCGISRHPRRRRELLQGHRWAGGLLSPPDTTLSRVWHT
eukprot:5219170-Prymnesium_polylepis.1